MNNVFLVVFTAPIFSLVPILVKVGKLFFKAFAGVNIKFFVLETLGNAVDFALIFLILFVTVMLFKFFVDTVKKTLKLVPYIRENAFDFVRGFINGRTDFVGGTFRTADDLFGDPVPVLSILIKILVAELFKLFVIILLRYLN